MGAVGPEIRSIIELTPSHAEPFAGLPPQHQPARGSREMLNIGSSLHDKLFDIVNHPGGPTPVNVSSLLLLEKIKTGLLR
jgi:hypothetical protein